MTDEELAKLRTDKKLYLSALVGSIFIKLINALLVAYLDAQRYESIKPSVGIVAICFMFYTAYVAWRFCRSLKIHIAWSIVNAIIAPFVYIFQAFFLLRRYVRQTGIKLNFFLSDRAPANA